MTSRWYIILALLALMTAIEVACDSEPTPTPSSTSAPTLVPTSMPTPPALEPSRYEELLRLMPDTPETRRSVYITDYALLREVWAIPPLGPDSDEQAIVDYLFRYLFPPGIPSPGLPPISVFFGNRQYLGFDLRDVHQSISIMAGEGKPSGQIEGLRGRFDPEATDEVLTACSECPHPLGEEHRGVSFYSWGTHSPERSVCMLAPPTFDPQGNRIAVQANYVYPTLATATMKALIDASLGQRPPLAGIEEFRLLVKGLSEIDAYTMFLTDKTQGFNEILQARCGGDVRCKERREHS